MMKRSNRLAALLAFVLASCALAYAPSASAGVGLVITNNTAAISSAQLATGDLLLVYTDTTKTHTLTLPGITMARILAVGGGGSGGGGYNSASTLNGAGGGGGAGGVVHLDAAKYASGTFTITVGQGGTGVGGGTTYVAGNNGTSSVVVFGGDTIAEALGGGGGGSGSVGNDGASGGGGSKKQVAKTGTAQAGGAATQGNAGGRGNANKVGGGGGGAGTSGADSSTAGSNGGDGLSFDITGTTAYYAAGGGGGTSNATATRGLGGSSVGGAGGTATLPAENGKNGTGSGGGGNGGTDNLSGRGGDGIVIVRISAMIEGNIEKPVNNQSFVYDGHEHILMQEIPFAYSITGTRAATDVGVYSFTVVMEDGYFWGDNPADVEAVTINWKITKAPNFINNFKMSSWKSGMPPSEPHCDHGFGTPVYTYYPEDSDTPLEGKPSVPGTYRVKAEIAGTDNYDGAVAGPITFMIREAGTSPMPNLGYFAEFLPGYTGAPTNDVYLLMKISSTKIANFEYRTPFNDGSDVFFCDQSGNLYPSEIEEWYPNGESSVWVKVPTLDENTKVVMCWGKLVDFPLPDHEKPWATKPADATINKYKTFSNSLPMSCPDGQERDKSKLKLENHWVKEPTFTPISWSRDTPVTPTVVNGTPAYGTSVISYYSYSSGETPAVQPTDAGAYAIKFTVIGNDDADNNYAGLVGSIDFTILDHSPYSASVDALSGRVMTAGNDQGGEPKVTYQAYYQTTTTFQTFWEHLGSAAKFNNLLASETHNYYTANKEHKLWALHDVRIGNSMPTGTGTGTNGLLSTLNYLPWSTPIQKSSSSSIKTPVPRSEVAQLVLRNTLGAEIYSSCFEDGIGTIYFDAVNGGISEDGENYKIIVEWATNCVDVAGNPTNLPPTDAYVCQVITNQDPFAVTTNLYGYANWQPLKMIPLKRDGTDYFVREEPVYTNALSVVNGGGTNNFYRIYIPVEYHGFARFKISRVSLHPSYTGNPDAGGLILLDNIIVSYPAMRTDLTSYGIFDPAKGGKQILGQENAWSVPFPAIGEDDVKARAIPDPYTNPGNPAADPSTFVVAAKMNYRWRYLDQSFYHDGTFYPTDDHKFNSVALSAADGFKSPDTLDIPNIPGDIEYWYELTLNAPFYSYADYSGTGLGVKWVTGGVTNEYSEEIAVVTNRAEGVRQQSCGTDWFVRLREGKSDYEIGNIVVRTGNEEDGYIEKRVEMELIGNHTWRGYLQTLTNQIGTVEYHIEYLNKQTPGSDVFEYNARYLYSVTPSDELPITGLLDEAAETDWTPLKIDATTGYLMFQVDDSTRSITIVHADYQNFNAWNDAKKAVFVGSSVEDESKCGVSQNRREYEEDFIGWQTMRADNPNWTLFSYPDIKTLYGRTAYQAFGSDNDGIWSIGPGQWVAKYYSESAKDSGVAVQMEGCGKGFVQFSDAENVPRGIESLSFNARLGQFINFTDFCYYDGEIKTSMKNYMFMSRVAFDTNKNQDFSGAAALSLVAYYRPAYGCYEARWEQLYAADANLKKAGDVGNIKDPAPKKKGQRLCLYRWNIDKGTGKLSSKMLCAWTNGNFEVQQANGYASNAGFMPFFISVENDSSSATLITVAVNESQSVGSDGHINSLANSWRGFCYKDTSANRLSNGTYGVLSTNCKGTFFRPQVCSAPLPRALIDVPTDGNTYKKINNDSGKPLNFSTAGTITECKSQLDNDLWIINVGRMAYGVEGTDVAKYHIHAAPFKQPLGIYTAEPGKAKWTLKKRENIETFGASGATQNFKLDLYTTDDCSVRISVDSEFDDARADIIIDSVVLRQWRGNDYTDSSEMEELVDGAYKRIPNWSDPNDFRGMTNFVFTSCWITNKVTGVVTNGYLLMSAKRTAPGTPCSIRSPLLDGSEYGRGKGLGMFSFSYMKANENVNLLVQIATNGVFDVDSYSFDKLDDSYWTTVTNFSFKGLSATDLASGTRSCYIGLHDISGLMRILMDTNVVAAAVNKSDPEYGQIFIDKVFCRDEPALDIGSWWGWNVRTIGANSDGVDNERKMYLPDLTTDPDKIGLSIALNNSITANTDTGDAETYRQHKPFVQTPTFVSNVVGEVMFRARKYDNTAQPASVTLFGSYTGAENSDWVKLHSFVISNSTYSTYSFKTEPGQSYAAFRMAVTGVPGVVGAHDSSGHVEPEIYDNPVRVLIDEVLVSEAVRARMAFRNVGAFRSDMQGTAYVPNVPSEQEQPLCNEGWGVECEIYPAQLPDDIDLTLPPTVVLHWYDDFASTGIWGYENWCTNSRARQAVLSRATNTNMIYRSSYLTSPDAVMEQKQVPGSIVQYTLEVRYYQKGSSTMMTNWLSSLDWQRPSWYRPLDLNRDYGRGTSFAAYNILDTVAPGWAWINEANIYGLYDYNWINSEENKQFIEVAVPMEADITGWSVRLLGVETWSDEIVTNTIGVFGSTELPGMKKDGGVYAASNMVFRVLANLDSAISGNLKESDGTLDGVWTFQNTGDTFFESGEIEASGPFGIQLVRASGIIEHEVLCVGTNFYGSMPGFEQYYHPSNNVNFLNENLPEARFFYIGEDTGGEGRSLGVFTGHGDSTNCWNNTMTMTPGRINENQDIDPDHPTPNGETIIIFANVDNDFGHIVQSVGEAVETNASQMVFIKKGSDRGTNIVYKVDPWYKLETVTTNGKASVFSELAQPRTYVATVGVGAQKNVTVVAKAGPKDELIGLGITDDNRYKPAVMKWLEGHKDLHGNDWANPDSDTVKLAQFVALSGNVITNMTLTQMYWLDMDPTMGDLIFKAGMAVPPGDHIVDGYMGTTSLTNTRMGVYMMISNKTENTASPFYGLAWTPYALRGLAPGENSLDYDNTSWGWTSVTFKVQGILANGITSEKNERNWVPMRWFVFHDDSFKPLDSATDAGISRIEVKDPFSTESPAYNAGWYDWMLEHGKAPVFFSWSIDDRIKQISVEVLKQINYYE